MSIHKIKKFLLVTPGVLELAWWFSARAGKHYGIKIRKRGNIVELRRANEIIRILARQVKRAPDIYRNFERYRRVLPIARIDNLEITDFSNSPDAAVWQEMCLKVGVTIEARDGAIWLRKENRVMILCVRHFVYSVTIGREFDLYFDQLVPHEQNGLLILDYSRPGTVQRYAQSGLEFEMASFPEEEEAIEEYFRWYRPQPGDLVFDMGAHCGVSTYKLSQLVGTGGKVISFEPDPVNYNILKRNIERHGLKNVVAVNMAVAGRTGALQFNCEGTIGSSLASLMLRESVGTTATVDAITMNDAFERWGPPTFCKIDIEGAEIEVLAAAKDTLRQYPAHLAIDTNHPQADGSLTDRAVEEILSSYGYELLSEAKPLMTTWARPMKS